MKFVMKKLYAARILNGYIYTPELEAKLVNHKVLEE